MFIIKNILLRILPFKILLLLNIYKKADYFWMIHPIKKEDIVKRYKFLNVIPNKLFLFILKIIPPLILSQINGLKDKYGEELTGYIIGCFLLPSQTKDKNLTTIKVLKSIKLAYKLKAKIFGIGGLISIDLGTEEVIREKFNIIVNNGGALATIVMYIRLKELLESAGKTFSNVSLAIINSTSLKGRIMSEYLSKFNFKNILLVASKIELLNVLKKKLNNENVKISDKIEDIKNYDIVLIAPSGHRVDFKIDYFKDNMIIYDINDPLYDLNSILKKYPNIKLLSNGLINTREINYNYNLGIPNDSSFCCLAETFLLASDINNKPIFYNNIKLLSVNKIKDLFLNSNFYLK